MSFYPAKLDGMATPRVVQKAIAANEVFDVGALLLVDANGEYAECGADPASVAVVSIAEAGEDTEGFGGHGRREFPPGEVQGVPVAEGQLFTAEFTGAIGDVGTAYGVAVVNGEWVVDFGDVTATAVVLVDKLDEVPGGWPGRVLVRFESTAVQEI